MTDKTWTDEVIEGMRIALEFMQGGIENGGWTHKEAIDKLETLLNQSWLRGLTSFAEPMISKGKKHNDN